MARSLASAGYNVVVASGDHRPRAVTELEESDEVGSVSYVGLGESLSTHASPASTTLDVFLRWGRKTAAWLAAQPTAPSHVIVYGGSAQYMCQVQRWCRRNSVPLIADVVEWYDPRHLRGGIFGPAHLKSMVALRYQYPRCDGVIAISSLLAEHYRRRGCRVVRIPPTVDVEGVTRESVTQRRPTRALTLVYAGVPGKKDALAQILRGVGLVDPSGDKVRLVVAGPTASDLLGLLNVDELPPGIDVLGSVPQQTVPKVLRTADFSVLLREPKRFANAGLPTKFVESLANATPVIANLTSDLGEYLHDGVEGLVSADHSAGAFSDALYRAAQLTPQELANMRNAAQVQALRSFDFRRHAQPLSDLLEHVRG
jgi:glycosyltransferase involved in cell wall biosynthesis